MKQKNGSLQTVTNAYLDKALDERFGLYDKKMEARFRGIDGKFKKIDGKFKKIDDRFKLSEINTDIKLENLERKIDEKAQRYRDEVLTSNDKLAKTLETIREEMEIGFYHNKQKLDNHEKRIKVLESA